MPDDITVSYEFDQSPNVVGGAASPCCSEAVLGALLTGLMVLLFLRDWRSRRSSSSHPVRAAGRRRRAVGRRPDDQHHDARRPGARRRHPGRRGDGRDREHPHAPGARHARSRARCSTPAAKSVVPRLLAMLCVLAVFVPSFFMTGVSRSLFVPLSLAVGFAMIASYLLSSTLVPVLSVWLLGDARTVAPTGRARPTGSSGCATASARCCSGWRRPRGLLVAAYLVVTRRHRRRRRPDARARDLSAERRQGSSSCGSARRPARSSSRPSGSAATCST